VAWAALVTPIRGESCLCKKELEQRGVSSSTGTPTARLVKIITERGMRGALQLIMSLLDERRSTLETGRKKNNFRCAGARGGVVGGARKEHDLARKSG